LQRNAQCVADEIEHYKLVLLFDLEWPEEKRVDAAENGGVCADAARRGHESGDGEARARAQSPEGNDEILSKSVHACRATSNYLTTGKISCVVNTAGALVFRDLRIGAQRTRAVDLPVGTVRCDDLLRRY